MIRSLTKASYQVLCFAPEDEYVSPLIDEGIEIYPITQLQRKGKNPRKDLLLVRELKRLYIQHGINLAIHFTIKPNIYGSIAARQAGIPSIAVVTGLGYTFLSHGLSNRLAHFLYRYAFRQNQLSIFQNPDDRELFIRKSLVSPERSTVILGSGIDTDRFVPDEDVPEIPVFLFVGRLLYDKGIRETLEGFSIFSKNHPEARLVVLGDRDDQNPASISEQDLSRYQDNPAILFAGFQSDVRSYIRESSVLLLPSYREGVPRTLLEALSTGRPIIATDVPGCREVVEHGVNGLLVPVKNAHALAQAMEEFYHMDQISRIKMGRKSRELAESKFSTRIINEQYLNEIQRILQNTGDDLT